MFAFLLNDDGSTYGYDFNLYFNLFDVEEESEEEECLNDEKSL